LPVGVQERLRPLLSMLLSEAARGEVTTETTGRIGDDQDHA
jgi:hypothetical protein